MTRPLPLVLKTTLLLALAGIPAAALALAPAAGAAGACPVPLRIAVLDFDEALRKGDGVGMTALQTALAKRIGEVADVPVTVRAYPYVRALRSFRLGHAEAVLIAEGAGRRAVAEGTRIPLMRLLFVRVGVEGRALLPAAGDLGTLNGLVPPTGAIFEGETVQRVTNYDALLRQLLGGRVNRILGARPSIDSFLADHPEARDALGPMQPVGEEPMSIHLRPDLGAGCRSRLAAAARVVAEHDLEAVFRRTVPDIDPTPFLLGAPRP